MSGCQELYERVSLLDFRDGALLHGVIPNLNICTNLGITCNFPICPLDSLYHRRPSLWRPSAIVNFSTIIVPGSGIRFTIKRAEEEE